MGPISEELPVGAQKSETKETRDTYTNLTGQ